MRPTLAATLLFGLFTSGGCARILMLLPFPGKSHHMFATAIAEALAERGHHIVEYSPYPPKTTIANHTHHELHTTFEQRIDSWTFEDVIAHAKISNSFILGAKIQRIWAITYEVCEDTLKDERIQKLLKSKEKIDLIIAESTFGQESLLVLGHILSAPTVVLETFFPHSLINWVAGNALSVASVPDLQAVEMSSEKMTFYERTMNLISTVWTLYLYHNVHLPKHDSIARRAAESAGLKSVPPLEQLVANVSLYLTNSHPAAINYIQPYTPNMVAVGGVAIKPDKQLLSQELQQFMDASAEGVVYFSFGSVVPAHSMTNDTLQIFINAFKRLPQKVLWKIDMTNVQVDLPSNVKTVKWAPQLAVMVHPNCRLFITHGGLFSHQEAMYAGVPTVGVPFFADQPYNVRHSESRGTGVRLSLSGLDGRTLYEAITTVLNDPRYKENAKKMSQIYRDRPVSPKDSAVYWVEYVLTHRGAHHLKPTSATMAWYKLFLLDVIAFFASAVLIVVLIVYKITRYFCKILFRRGETKLGKNKKLN